MSSNHHLIKKYFNLLVQQFIPNRNNISINIVFKNHLGGQTLGHTDWNWQGYREEGISSGNHAFEVSFLNHYEDEERWRGTICHEFAHVYLFLTIGDHTHDDRFYSHMERFENWLDQNQGLTPRQDKSSDWNQHIDSSKNEERQKKPCTSCGEREIPYNTAGECFSCHNKPKYRNELEKCKGCSRMEKIYTTSGKCFQCYQENEKHNEHCREASELNRLTDLLKNSKTLTELEKNYQTVKNHSLYDSSKRTVQYFSNAHELPNEDNKTRQDILSIHKG